MDTLGAALILLCVLKQCIPRSKTLGILFSLVHRNQVLARWQDTTKAVYETMQWLVEIDREQHEAAVKAVKNLFRKKT